MAESYKPTEGMIAEANRGLEWRRGNLFLRGMKLTKKQKVSDQEKKAIQATDALLGRYGVVTLAKVGVKKQ
jgi:hypothetical protein